MSATPFSRAPPARPSTTQRVSIPVPGTNITLEGFLATPTDESKMSVFSSSIPTPTTSTTPSTTGPKTAVLVTHPHPKLGGDAFNNVPMYFSKIIPKLLQYPILRFNTRGVGQSTGSSSWFGSSEADDVIAALIYLTDSNGPVSADRVYIVGYSFGACILGTALANIFTTTLLSSSSSSTTSSPVTPFSRSPSFLTPTLATRLSRVVKGGIFVSYPCGFFSRMLLGGHIGSLRALAAASSLPLLFITCDGDELTSSSAIKSRVDEIKAVDCKFVTLPEGSHSWYGDEARLGSVVIPFIQNIEHNLNNQQISTTNITNNVTGSTTDKGNSTTSSNTNNNSSSSENQPGHFFRGRIHQQSRCQTLMDHNIIFVVLILVLFIALNWGFFAKFSRAFSNKYR